MTAGLDEIDEILDPEIAIPDDVEPELSDILPRGYLSPSQIGTFLKCPRSWALSYIEGKKRRTAARMFQGIFVHNGVEAVLKARLATGTLPPSAMALDAFSDAFDTSKHLIEDWEGDEPGSVKDVGIKCTEAYYDEAAQHATPIAIEKTITTIIRSADGKLRLPILGRIDSIQVQAHSEQEYQDVRAAVLADPKAPVSKPRRINDLKVVTDKWSEADLANDLQFALYAGAEHVPDVQVDQVVKGRAKVPRPRYEKLTGVMTPTQVNHAAAVAEGVAYGIAHGVSTGRFPMTDPGNWWCHEKWCSMWFHCRGKGTTK